MGFALGLVLGFALGTFCVAAVMIWYERERGQDEPDDRAATDLT